MPLHALEVFCNVARYRSFSKGAERSGITQSAASQRIRALEEEYGVQLVDRSTRPLRLTAAGRTYYQGARKILDRYDRLLQSVIGEGRDLRGHLELGSIYSADRTYLNDVLADMRGRHPEVEVQVVYLHPQELHDALRSDRCDVGILSYPDRWPDLMARPLGDESMALVCHPAHPMAARDRVSPPELDNFPLVGFDPGLPISRDIQAFLRKHGGHPRVSRSFDNIDTIRASLSDPSLMAILPERTVQLEVDRGVLVAVPLDPGLVRPMALVCRRDREFTPALEALVTCLIEHDARIMAEGKRNSLCTTGPNS
jgi:DNA-binding transcriptional LysR family regulator